LSATNDGGFDISETDAKARLIEAGKSLFAEQGYSATSVRQICALAGTSSTMIHHYFSSKDGLYQAILDEFTSQTFAVPLRIIEEPAASLDEFKFKMQMFIGETLQALITQVRVLMIMNRENGEFVNFQIYMQTFTAFLETAKESGFVRPDVDIAMVTGLILDRLGNQVMMSVKMPENSEFNVVANAQYRKRWLKANSAVLVAAFALPGPAG
jgi:AcrR family transcriptional regulator